MDGSGCGCHFTGCGFVGKSVFSRYARRGRNTSYARPLHWLPYRTHCRGATAGCARCNGRSCVASGMLKKTVWRKQNSNISEQNTYTDQPVIQNEDEFPATDDKKPLITLKKRRRQRKTGERRECWQKKQALETEEPKQQTASSFR